MKAAAGLSKFSTLLSGSPGTVKVLFCSFPLHPKEYLATGQLQHPSGTPRTMQPSGELEQAPELVEAWGGIFPQILWNKSKLHHSADPLLPAQPILAQSLYMVSGGIEIMRVFTCQWSRQQPLCCCRLTPAPADTLCNAVCPLQPGRTSPSRGRGTVTQMTVLRAVLGCVLSLPAHPTYFPLYQPILLPFPPQALG